MYASKKRKVWSEIMLHALFLDNNNALLAFGGILFAFLATVIATAKLCDYLPKDAGREFAHDGKLSAGKPRGAGIIFVLAFVAAALLFVPMNAELIIYLILIVISMMTGFLDDASKTPWGEYKKGFLDLCVAALVALNFLKHNSNVVELALFDVKFTLHPLLFGFLTIILVWASVNVTNCSDGVDGLSGTLTIITIMTIYVIDRIKGCSEDFSFIEQMRTEKQKEDISPPEPGKFPLCKTDKKRQRCRKDRQKIIKDF